MSKLFRGMRQDEGEWVVGYYVHLYDGKGNESHRIYPGPAETDCGCYYPDWYVVWPETVGESTGMKEWVVTDPSVCAPLFEGDIVEVWTHRKPCTEYGPTSQYDGVCKARATIVFKNGEWQLDYDNAYNHKLEELHGKEDLERTVKSSRSLFFFGHHGGREDWYREHNKRYRFGDIVCIGNIHENPELLKASV